MGYTEFTIIVAAGGVLIFWLWHRSYNAVGRNGRTDANGLPQEPVPPFKRTISGPSQAELEQARFVERINSWQKAHSTPGKLNGMSTSLSGTKYTYVPRKRNGEPLSTSS